MRHGGGNRVEGGLHGRCWARLRDGNACAGMDSSDEDDEDGMGMEVIEDDEDAMVETKAKKKRTRKRRNRDYVKRSRKRHRTVEVNRVKLWTEGQVYVQWVGDHEDSLEPAENFKALCLVDDEVVDEDGQSAWFREVREKATRTSRRSKNGGWHNAHAGGIGDRCLSTSDSEVPEGAGATREDLAPEFKAIDKRCLARSALSDAFRGPAGIQVLRPQARGKGRSLFF